MSEIEFYFILGGFFFIILFILLLISVKKILKFLRKKQETETTPILKCLDGHKVRSKGELIVDDYLHLIGLEHEYEKIIRVDGSPIKVDWYLPESKVYIEYWGFHGKNYEKRKEEKLKLYRKGKLKLISIENFMFEDIYSYLEHELKKFVNLEKADQFNKHCPNCGMRLDNRFLV